ncbi:MAG: hypothetical protein K0B07_01985 [DPANN group archaeon]|nr:hypothetical protein [DPANN group archaeon]
MAEDTKDDIKDIEESENVISVGDFDNLENKEKKKSVSGIFDKLVSKGNNTKKTNDNIVTAYNPKEDTEIDKVKRTIDEMTIKTDKIEGKLEMIDSIEKDKNEEISKLTEEIGELRSMIFDREKSFSDVLTKFEKIKDATEEINPERIKIDMDRKEKKILELEAKLDMETERNTTFEKQITKINKVYDNIKSIESLTNITTYIDKQIKKIKDEKDYINRTTSKVEQIFFELNKKQETLDNIDVMIQDNKELLEDNIRAIDAVELKFDNMITKKDMGIIKKELGLRVDKTEEKMLNIKDLMSILIEKTMANETKINKKEESLSHINSQIEKNTELSEDNVHAIKEIEKNIENVIGNDLQNIKKQLDAVLGDNKNQMENIINLVSTLNEKTIVNEKQMVANDDVIDTSTDNYIPQDTINNQIDITQKNNVTQIDEGIKTTQTDKIKADDKEIYEKQDVFLEFEDDASKTISVQEQNDFSDETEKKSNLKPDINSVPNDSLESLIEDYDSRIETKSSENKKIA